MASIRAAKYPGTPEALVSLVSLGDLFLAGHSPAAALAAFDAYLRDAPTGTLAPEALAGRACALIALDRRSEGDAAWGDLTRRFPGALTPERVGSPSRARP